MAINSWLSPKITDKISECVPFIQKALTALLKMEPASISDVPEGAKRMTLPNASQWKIEKYDGTNWVAAGKLMHDVDTVDGYHAAITPAKNTIAVRNSSGVLQDSITGNAATATKAVALSEINPVSMGGTGSNTAVGARTNLGVPPIAHASTANTYGLGTDTDYGHLKLSDSTSGTESVANGTAATPAAVKAVNDSAVHLTGDETIAGTKTFTSVLYVEYGSPTIRMINTDVVKGIPPSAIKVGSIYTLIESKGYSDTSNILGAVKTAYRTNGTVDTRLYAYKPEAGSTEAAFISIIYPASGYPYAECPTPKDSSGNIDTSDNSTKIATTAWSHSAFDGKIAECVKTVNGNPPDAAGNATISFAPTVFNTRLVITSSNSAWTPPVTGWACVTVIGGGGAGGDGTEITTAGKGGGQGGTSSFGDISAKGGSGGGGAGSGDPYAPGGGGGGGAGKISTGYIYLNTTSPVKIVIGAGGLASQTSPTAVGSSYFGGDGQGPEGGHGGNARQGGVGAPGAGSGGYADAKTGYDGNGGSGAITGYGYGGGGGGGRAISVISTGDTNTEGWGGSASDGGAAGSSISVSGGAGGPGAVIIEYYDPAKEVA